MWVPMSRRARIGAGGACRSPASSFSNCRLFLSHRLPHPLPSSLLPSLPPPPPPPLPLPPIFFPPSPPFSLSLSLSLSSSSLPSEQGTASVPRAPVPWPRPWGPTRPSPPWAFGVGARVEAGQDRCRRSLPLARLLVF